MKRPLLVTTSLLAAGALLVGCTAVAGAGSSSGAESAQLAFSGDLSPAEVLAANADYTTVNEDEWSESGTVDVKLSGSGATSDSAAVASENGTGTISESGVYRLSGSLAGGVVVAAPDDALVVLILDGARIDNADGAAIDVRSADDVAIHLAEGSENSLSDAASYADDRGDAGAANAALYADADLTISGTGSLTVMGNGNDGITSTDDLVILSGTIAVTAADDALRGKDALVVEGGSLDLAATGGDGMKSDGDDDVTSSDEASADIDWTRGYIYVSGGEIDIAAGDDGLQAFTDAVIEGGAIAVAAADDGIQGEAVVSVGGGEITVAESTEAMEAASIGIFAGTIDLTASDDGINASGLAELQARIDGTEFTGVADREADTGERLEISGGTLTIVAGADGLDSNGSIAITGGSVDITSAANGGDGPIDANGELSVAEGVVTANGAAWDESMATGPGGGPGMGGGPGDGQGGAPGTRVEMPEGGGPGGAEPPRLLVPGDAQAQQG